MVTRYTPDELVPEMYTDEVGEFVKYEDYAAREAKSAELAAENEVLKSCVDGWCDMPATDAFLAEVRAQGVEMFARSLRGEAEITKACTFKPVQQFEEFAARADECAAQLRQEAAQ